MHHSDRKVATLDIAQCRSNYAKSFSTKIGANFFGLSFRNVVEIGKLRERERGKHTRSRSQTKGYIYVNQFSSPFLQTCRGNKKNKPGTTIIYTTEREDTIIDRESCVNVREWRACVNMGETTQYVCVNAYCVRV